MKCDMKIIVHLISLYHKQKSDDVIKTNILHGCGNYKDNVFLYFYFLNIFFEKAFSDKIH